MITKFNKNQRAEKRQILFSILLGSVLLVIMSFLVISNFRINQKRTMLNEQREYLQKQLQILEEKRDHLQAQISEVSQEDYLETEAREKFNLKKTGEEVVSVLPPKEEAPVQIQEKQWWNPFTW